MEILLNINSVDWAAIQGVCSFIALLVALYSLIKTCIDVENSSKEMREEINAIKSGTIEQVYAIQENTKSQVSAIQESTNSHVTAIQESTNMQIQNHINQTAAQIRTLESTSNEQVKSIIKVCIIQTASIIEQISSDIRRNQDEVQFINDEIKKIDDEEQRQLRLTDNNHVVKAVFFVQKLPLNRRKDFLESRHNQLLDSIGKYEEAKAQLETMM